MLWLPLTLLALLGGVLLAGGLRGRRVNDHPHCRRCRFDLVGLYPGREACPECGSDLAGSRAIRAGRREASRGLAAVGGLLLLVGIGGGGAMVVGAAIGFDWNTLKPVGLLSAEIARRPIAEADAAAAEIRARVVDNRLTPPAAAASVESILARQGNPDLAWSAVAGDLLEYLRAQRAVTDEQWHAYLRNAVAFEVRSRRTVRTGAPLLLHARAATERVGSPTPGTFVGYVRYRLVSAQIDGEPVTQPRDRPWQPINASVASMGSSSGSSSLPTLSRPGRYTIRSTWAIASFEGFEGNHTEVKWTDDGVTVTVPYTDRERTVEFVHEIEVVDAPEPLIEAVRDEATGEHIRRRFRVDSAQIADMGGARPGMMLYVSLPSPPMDVAARVAARVTIDGETLEFPVGVMTVKGGLQSHGFSWGFNAQLPEGVTPDRVGTVDLIIRADRHAAEETLAIERIWDGEVVIPGVRVQPMTGGGPLRVLSVPVPPVEEPAEGEKPEGEE